MGELTERQAEILGFISQHCRDSGYPPTVREIGFAVGLQSPSTVHAHLAKLENAGHIKRDPTKPRAMFVCNLEDVGGAVVVTDEDVHDRPPNTLPLYGAVAAGAPILTDDQVEGWIATPFRGDFLLSVRGDSMRDAGILDGDMVAVRKQPIASEGEIVVARIEEEATVKRLHLDGERVLLMPENPAYEPIVPDHVDLVGKVVGVMRHL